MVTAAGTVLEARNISKSYRLGAETVAAVRGVSLTLHAGEIVAVVGPSGSGKTTLAHVLGGLITPDSGEVIVGDASVSAYSDKKLSRYRNKTVGFVFQNFSLLSHYNVLENVALPLVPAKCPPSERRKRALECLRMMGIEAKAEARATDLSGGERQRVAIARALVANPKIIIADEPTGSLDSKRAQEIMTILTLLAHKKNVTVVMVTHDQTLASQADRVIAIRDGSLQKGGAR